MLIADIPGLASFARKATLLRPAAGAPGLHESSVAGPLLWPADEAWPVCRGPHLVEARDRLADADRETMQRIDRDMRARRAGKPNAAWEMTEEEADIKSRIMDGAGALDMLTWERVRHVPVSSVNGVPMVAVLQLHARDVPAAAWPEGMDVLQVVWCPKDHSSLPGQPRYWGPAVEMRYRSAATMAAVLVPPVSDCADKCYVPRPCALGPVEVTDLPDRDELPEELVDAQDAWADRHGIEFDRSPACHEGWKVGGWPSWHSTDLVPVNCSCGATARLFLTVDSGGAAGVNVGRFGELRVFTCPVDATHPIRLNIQ